MRSKGSKLPKYVYKQTVKGKTYYRFRQGKLVKRLPGSPSTPEFHAAYAKLLTTPDTPIGRYNPGSVAHTIELYVRSPEYADLEPSTRRDYVRYLARLDRSVGDRAFASIDRPYIFAIRDKLQETPVAANHTVAVISALFRWAIKRGLAKANPAEGIERLKGGDGYRRWDDSELDTFLASASPMMALALLLGVCTGQRLSDVTRFTWSAFDGEWIHFRQQKTKTHLDIPLRRDLIAILSGTAKVGVHILTTRTGRPFHSRVFSRDFRDARIEAGLPDDLSFHGLRHTAASVLAELGCSAPEIQAITGHKSLKLVQHYITQASQKKLAASAIARLQTAHSAKHAAKPGSK